MHQQGRILWGKLQLTDERCNATQAFEVACRRPPLANHSTDRQVVELFQAVQLSIPLAWSCFSSSRKDWEDQ